MDCRPTKITVRCSPQLSHFPYHSDRSRQGSSTFPDRSGTRVDPYTLELPGARVQYKSIKRFQKRSESWMQERPNEFIHHSCVSTRGRLLIQPRQPSSWIEEPQISLRATPSGRNFVCVLLLRRRQSRRGHGVQEGDVLFTTLICCFSASLAAVVRATTSVIYFSPCMIFNILSLRVSVITFEGILYLRSYVPQFILSGFKSLMVLKYEVRRYKIRMK